MSFFLDFLGFFRLFRPQSLHLIKLLERLCSKENGSIQRFRISQFAMEMLVVLVSTSLCDVCEYMRADIHI